MNKKLIGLTGLLSLALLLVGCSDSTRSQGETPPHTAQATETAAESEPAAPPTQAAPTPEAALESAPDSVANSQPAQTPQEIPPFDHELSAEEYSWRQLLPRDGIRPIYEDELQFAPAEEAPYSPDELVIGVEINGEARAYAIGPLNRREMVNDTVGGTPILVTW